MNYCTINITNTIKNRNKTYFKYSMPSALTLTAFLWREVGGGGGGGLLREGGLLKISTSRQGVY